MKAKQFLQAMRGLFLTLAATVTLSGSFSSCKSDEPDVPPQPQADVTLDLSKAATVKSMKYDAEALAQGHYDLHLYLSEDQKERIQIQLDRERHDSKTIDLTKHEPNQEDAGEWAVNYYDANGMKLIEASGQEKSGLRVFLSGTLRVEMTDEETHTFRITFENATIKGHDDKLYRLDGTWEGQMTEPEPDVMLDLGKAGTVAKVVYKIEYMLAGYYIINIYLSEDHKEHIRLELDREHHDGKVIDLTQYEPNQEDAYEWSVVYYDANGEKQIDAFALESGVHRIFRTGKLKVEMVDEETRTFRIAFTNARIKGYDDKEYLISGTWEGTMQSDADVTVDLSKAGTVKSTGYDADDLAHGNYDLYLYLSADRKEYIEIQLDHQRHDGKTIDLTQKNDEDLPDAWEWVVKYMDADGEYLFETGGQEYNTYYRVFEGGTLRVEMTDEETHTFRITFSNASIKGGNRKTYLFTGTWEGQMPAQ